VADVDDIRARLATIADELADLAYEAVRAQVAGASAAAADERRLTRARRAVEKAAAALRDPLPSA